MQQTRATPVHPPPPGARRTDRRFPHLRAAAFLLIAGWLIIATGVSADSAVTRQSIDIESDRAELDQLTGRSSYSGNVTLTQGEAVIRGERIVVTQPPDGGPIHIEITGEPVTYHEPRTDPEPPVDARATRMQYSADSEILHLSGQARVARGNDVLRGDDIRYHRREGRILASGGTEEGGRVQIIISPDEGGEQP